MKYVDSVSSKLPHWVMGVFSQYNRIRPFIFPTGFLSHPGSEKTKPKPPYVCLGCSNHIYSKQYVEQIQYLNKLQAKIFTNDPWVRKKIIE
jgi:hypothetical protein